MSNNGKEMNESKSSKPLQLRHWLLGGGLAVTLAATMWAAQSGDADEAAVQAVAGGERRASSDTSPSSPSSRSVSSKTGEPKSAATDWSPVQRQVWVSVTPAELSAWSPPPPPAPPTAPPPPPPQVAAAPMAPPFPYQLIGRMDEGSASKPQAVVFLSSPVRSAAVRTGELLDGQWRVDQIGPAGITVTWMPTQLKQTIAFRPAS